jgi:hypothetical protein
MVKSEYKCKEQKCDRIFACYNSMYAHYQASHKPARYECPVCHLRYKRHVSRCLHYYQAHVKGVVNSTEKKNEKEDHYSHFCFNGTEQTQQRGLGNYNFISLF